MDTVELARQFEALTRSDTLHDIVNAIIDAAQVDESGELTPEAVEALDAMNLTLQQKVEAYHVVHNELTESATGNKALKLRYECRQRMYEARAERLMDRLFAEMQRLGTREVKTQTVRACITDSNPSVELRDGVSIDSIPPEFVVVKRDVNKGALCRAMKAGREFAFATLRKGQHLRWR